MDDTNPDDYGTDAYTDELAEDAEHEDELEQLDRLDDEPDDA